MKIILVMIGGFLGSISRFTLGEWIHLDSGFPFGTLLINLIGCFILAWLLTFVCLYRKVWNPYISLFFGTGFIGSFTTFSTFSVETIQLWQNHLWLQGFLYIFASVLGGIFAALLGVKTAYHYYKEGDTK